MKPTIGATGTIDQAAKNILAPFGEIVVAPDGKEESLLPLVDDAIALVVRGEGVANRKIIESLDILEDALDEGRLAAVGLDVFAPEPPDVNHPIFARENCLTSPHALGMTKRAMSKVFMQMAGDMAAVLKGGRPRHAVNPEVFE